ncbi:MAG: hypothetical protein K2P45_04875 [Eubacterium sp.]|nr:hypothetical protein [Eubacterium sp.]
MMEYNEEAILSKNEYQIFEKRNLIIFVSGVISRSDKCKIDLYSLAEQALSDTLNFNKICGWYRIAIHDKKNNSWVFWGDHAGSQCFFINDQESRFCDSLLWLNDICKQKKLEPDLYAVSELFQYRRIFGNRTIFRHLKKTDPDHYYRLSEGRIIVKEKRLHSFSKLPENYRLSDVFDNLISKESKICAVCTGGTDSRAVLAHLIYRGFRPDLYITGHLDNPDIRIAKKLAQTLDLPLTIISPKQKEENWIEKAICFTDGAYDAVLSYRHFQKAQYVKDKGYLFEFGGVGGEFYKNSFCHPFRNGFPRKNDMNYFYKNVIENSALTTTWCGEKVIKAAREDKGTLQKIARLSLDETNLLSACNRVGYELLRSSSGAITNGYARSCIKIDPLMDRNLVAAVSQKNLIKLSMHIWQRREIAKYCPNISNLKTDQGYSCSMNILIVFMEQMKRIWFYMNRVIARIRKKLGFDYKTAEAHYWDLDYKQARQTEEWRQSVSYCKKAGLLKSGIEDEMIPMAQTGMILLIGVIFSGKFSKVIDKYLQYDQEANAKVN